MQENLAKFSEEERKHIMEKLKMSPLFNIYPSDTTYLLEMDKNKHLKVNRYKFDILDTISSIEEGEDLVLGRSEFTTVSKEIDIQCQFIRASNCIARRSTRARANHILVKNLDVLETDKIELYDVATSIGRWKEVGYLYGSFKICCSDHLSEKEIYIFYKGRQNMDSMASVLEQDGILKIAYNQNISNFITKMELDNK